MKSIEKNEVPPPPRPQAQRKSILKNNFFNIEAIEKYKKDSNIKENVKITISEKHQEESKFLLHKVMKEHITAFFSNNIYMFIISFFTFYCMFADDIRMAFLPKSCDVVIDSFLIISMAFYGLELILSCCFKDGYLLSYYFVVDLFSTLSIIFDVQWLFDPYDTYNDYIQSKYNLLFK
jgi:hypothetical protein